MVGESGLVMGEPFKPNLKAHELPRATLVGLWRRTEEAHEKLCETWFAAVAERYGRDVADAVALGGWPLKKTGATPKELFFDDLRFIVAATELKPDMLTVADRDQAETPDELSGDRSWFQWFVSSSRLRGDTPSPRSGKPAWVGSPGRARGFARGKGIDLGFAVLLKAWQASQGTHASEIDTEAFEPTNRWYTGIRKRYGDEAAQKLEKDVWIDRGAAEHDLRIGQEAMGVTRAPRSIASSTSMTFA
jgi:hypothetical protein